MRVLHTREQTSSCGGMCVQGLTCSNASALILLLVQMHMLSIVLACRCIVEQHSFFLQLHQQIVCWTTPGWFPLPCPLDSLSLCWCMWQQHSVVSFCFLLLLCLALMCSMCCFPLMCCILLFSWDQQSLQKFINNRKSRPGHYL